MIWWQTHFGVTDNWVKDANMTNGKARSVGAGEFSGLMRSLRFRLHFLLLVLALPIIGIIAYTGVQERNRLIEEQAGRAQLIADHVTRDQAWMISRTHRYLTELSLLSVVQNATDSGCATFLAQQRSLGAQFSNIAVLGAGGNILCQARPLAAPLSIDGHASIRETLETGRFTLGLSSAEPFAGRPTLVFSVPVLLSGINPPERGAVVAAVPVSVWYEALVEHKLPEGMVSSLVDDNGNTLATHPSPLPLPEGAERASVEVPLFHDGKDYLLRMNLTLSEQGRISAATRRAVLRLGLFAGGLGLLWLMVTRQLGSLVFRPLDEMEREIASLSQAGAGEGHETAQGGAGTGRMAEFDRLSEGIRTLSSARNKAQEAERQRAEQIFAILEALPDTYFRISDEGTILDYKAGSSKDLYLPPHEFLGKRVFDIMPEHVCDKFRDSVEQQKKTQKSFLWEYVLEIGGEPRDFQAFTYRIEGRNENVVVIRDITDRKRAERGYHVAETRLHSIVANLPGAVVNFEVRGLDVNERAMSYVSPGSRAIWGYEPGEMLANPHLVGQLHDPDDLPRMRLALTHSAQTLTPKTRRFMITDRAGQKKWVEAHINAARIDSNLIQITIFLADMTEMFETQKQLEKQKEVTFFAQKHEIIGQLTGGVAHDFNNLLAVVMGNQELLRDELSDPEQIKLVDASIQAAQRGADLTRSMLAFARKARLAPVVIDLNELVSQLRGWSGRTFPANIAIETRAQEGLWKIEADPGSTESALLNLIVNARDAMPEGGRLLIETANIDSVPDEAALPGVDLAEGRYVMLSVCDTGVGIPADRLENVFEPFYTTKAPGAGSGLGLSMVQGFMHQSGGAVQVRSEPGSGTCFRLFFKAIEDRPGRPDATHDSTGIRATAHQRILVAEDEAEVLAVLNVILTRAGYQVTPVSTGDEAYGVFEADPTFDLLLTDIMMPGRLQGIALAAALRLMKPELPVIFISGYASEALVESEPALANDVRLMKPITRASLLTAIHKALGET